MKFATRPDEVYFFNLLDFSYLHFKKLTFTVKSNLELLILELLLLGGFFSYFDPSAGDSMQTEFHASGGFLVRERGQQSIL
jgi:hypothetical protein